MLQFVWLIVIGALMAEGAGYVWHRYACHVGTFRFLPHDLLRRRHFDHHMRKYPSRKNMRSGVYLESCEIAFKFLAAIILALAGALLVARLVPVWKAAVLLASATLYAHLVIGNLHSLYHVEDSALENYSAFRWLRDFHEVHHLVNANYSILLPIFDILGGSYVSPSKLSELRGENLFPGFKPSNSSSCGDSLLRS
jgi:sterol desaturase/sphingolipid hydroxylase (fatty acid hydroxylase superfamily)